MEENIFKNYPNRYYSFLIQVLSIEDNFLWFPEEEAREVFRKLSETNGAEAGMECLQKIYLTEEEQKRAEEEKNRKKERHCLAKQMKKVRRIRKDFTRQIAKIQNTEEQFAQLWDYVRYWTDREERSERRYITKKYLCSLFLKNQQMRLSRKETKIICEMVMHLFNEAVLTFPEMRKILDCIEISEEAA